MVFTPRDLVDQLLRDERYGQASGGGVTFSGGEPLRQPIALGACLERLGAAGVHRAVDTAGDVAAQAVRTVAPHVALWLWDVKTADERVFAGQAGGDLDRVLANLRWVLASALEADLPDEALRQRLRDAPKFGNDDDRADRGALRLLEIRRAATDRLEREHDHPPYLACHVVRSLHRLNGLGLGATPDGRHAGEPLADSLGAELGTATEGPTAMLNSVLKIDAAAYYGGGTNLNLALSPQAAEPGVLRALVDAFFDAGGQELQFNALDVATLRDALARPDRYRDLIVRIAGFNALWCKLSQAEREEIVARAVAAF
jgi:pyruvate-formate lyase